MTPKRKIQFTVLLFLAGCGALLFLVIIPLITNIQKHSQNLTSQKEVSDLLKKQIADLEGFQKNRSDYQSVLQQIDYSFLNFSAPVEFFVFLEQQAKKDNIQLDASPVFPDSSEKRLHINFQILTFGSFPDCLKFLDQLEHSPFSFEVSELAISRISDKETRFKQFKGLREGNVVFAITLKAFAKEKNVVD